MFDARQLSASTAKQARSSHSQRFSTKPMDGKSVAQAQVSSTSYFADEEGLIEEFQFDYDSLNAFDQAIVRTNAVPYSCLFLFTGLPIFPCFIPYMFICETQNVVDKNNATHVCITQDGIRYSVDRRKAGCRMTCATKAGLRRPSRLIKSTVTLKSLPEIVAVAGL